MVAKNYLTTFLDRAHQHPSDLAITYLRRGEFEDTSFTYQELAEAGQSWARGFLDTHETKEPVLLVYPPGPEFFVAILGCLFAGVVATPLPVPRPGESLHRLQIIIGRTRFGALISTQTTLASITRNRDAKEALGPIRMSCHEDLTTGPPTALKQLPGLTINPEKPILIQYSSGSTRAPQGAVLNSRCVVENGELCTESIRGSGDNCVVSWLPHHHDLGLFGALLYPLMKGMRTVHMAPHAFIQHPIRWLKAISHYRGTISGGPPLGFELCNRSISDERLNGIDLSSWANVFCGAEPVFSAPIDQFFKRFATTGLSRRSFAPVYGLAEATVFVAGTNRGDRSPPSPATSAQRREPCLLTAKSRQQIRIVDPTTLREASPGTSGEIWVHGPSIALGYQTVRLESPSQFHARTEPDNGTDYLRTGDLGFIDNDWLYITGRIKDMLIVNGENVHATDIEWIAAECDIRLNASAAAAFHREDGAHGDVILLIESHQKSMKPSEIAALVDQVRAKVLAETGVNLQSIAILPRGTLPKTTSGKVQRNRARMSFVAHKTHPHSSSSTPASQ